MNDVRDLLELALADGPAPGPPHDADPAGDLARGRRLLRRRRLAVLAGSVTAVAAVAVMPWAAITAAGGPASPRAQAAHPAQAPHSIALVAYQGQQPPGYRVAEMPSGWVVQGGNAYALTIAPRSDKDTNPDSFLGKLVVMLQSRDAGAPTVGTSQPVSGRPGRFYVQDGTQQLIFRGVDGRWVVVQAPASLGWDSTRLAQFAAGVQVLGNAQQGRG
jgi:hypothetical protein